MSLPGLPKRAFRPTPLPDGPDAGLLALVIRAIGLLLLLSALALPLLRAPDRPVESLLARWAQAPSTFIEIQGLRVHVRDEGPRTDPVPLLLIHGTGASLHTWDGWAEALKGQRRVIRFDLPGFGLTGPNASGDYSDDSLARSTLALMDTLALPRAVLVGNSLGGEVAWRVAAMAPERAERLVLIDSAGYDFTPQSVPPGLLLARLPLVNRLADHLLPRSVVTASVRNVYGQPERVSEALIDRYEEITLRSGNRQALRQRLSQLTPGAGAAQLGTLRLPTLILWGERDRLIPLENGKRFAQDIAGSTLVTFDSLGHVPHEEDPAATLVPLKRFLGLH